MWIPKWIVQQWQSHTDPGTLRAIVAENNSLRGRNMELEKRALAAEITNDWLRARLNQVETERAILLSKQVGVPFGAPVIHPASTREDGDGIPSIGDELSFEDIGDDKARQLGLEN